MNILLWVLQALLALHTIVGAVWKFSHSPEQTMPSLSTIPSGVWLAMSVIEILSGVALVIPALSKPLGFLVPIAAVCIAIEMLFLCGVHIYSGNFANYGPMIYWLVVAALCAFIAYGRFALNSI